MQTHYSYTVDDVEVATADLTDQGAGVVWSLDMVLVPQALRGNGYGSVILDMVLADADTDNCTLTLTCTPTEDSPIPARGLCKWFGRHSFVSAEEDIYSMTRPPNPELV